jgi:hypothetical protein
LETPEASPWANLGGASFWLFTGSLFAIRLMRGKMGAPRGDGRQPAGVEKCRSMSDSNHVKIERWRRYIDECRNEAKLLSPAGQRTMQTVIDGYERLIAMMLEQDKRKG